MGGGVVDDDINEPDSEVNNFSNAKTGFAPPPLQMMMLQEHEMSSNNNNKENNRGSRGSSDAAAAFISGGFFSEFCRVTSQLDNTTPGGYNNRATRSFNRSMRSTRSTPPPTPPMTPKSHADRPSHFVDSSSSSSNHGFASLARARRSQPNLSIAAQSLEVLHR